MFCRSTFGTLLKVLPRDEIQGIIESHRSDRWRKSFKTWDHLVAMLTAQFSGVTSLRELEVFLGEHPNQHYHLGFKGVKRSTLSDANKGRSAGVFHDIAQVMIVRAGRCQKREMRQVLSLLDASQITLKGRGYEWAKQTQTRACSPGLKLHVQMQAEEGLLDYADVTSTNVNDVVAAKSIPLERGRIYVFDKGYCDYNWWHQIITAGADFVTRLKRNAAYRVIETKQVTADQDNILADQVIELTNKNPRARKTNTLAGHPLRLIQIKHPGGKRRPFLIVTNILEAKAEQIALCYKKRWSIELLFKWIKQNLKIKRFVGQSRNAVTIQIFVALIAYVLLKLFKNMLGQTHKLRLKDVMIALRAHIFTRPDMHKRRQKYRDSLFQDQLSLWGQKI